MDQNVTVNSDCDRCGQVGPVVESGDQWVCEDGCLI
jgi:hypothetical protein